MEDYMKLFNIKEKLFLVVFIPLLALTFFSFSTISDKFDEKKEIKNIKTYLLYSIEAGHLIHVLQKERGLCSGYIGSDKQNFQEQFLNQQKSVDKYYQKVKNIILSDDILNESAKKSILENFRDIQNFRDKIKNTDISFYIAIEIYNKMINKLIDSISDVVLISTDYKLSQSLLSYISLIKAKNYSGLERALLNYTFSSQRLFAQDFSSFKSNKTLFNTHIEDFTNNTHKKMKLKFKDILESGIIKNVEYIQEFIDNKMMKNEIISDIKALSGYGGLIHDFKNYVLRGENKYADRFLLKYKKLSEKILKYKTLKSTDKEILLLDIIQSTFKNYRDNLIEVKESVDILTVVELDERVKIDDSPAIDALEKLSSSVIGIDAQKWFTTSTIWIDKLLYVEEEVANLLLNSITEKNKTIDKTLKILIGMISALLVFVILLSLILIKDILHKLDELQDGLTSFLDFVTRRKETFNLLKVYGNDEFSIMTKILNDSISQTAIFIEDEVTKSRKKDQEIMKKLEYANRAKSDFLANMSHEIRTPLNGIIGFVDILYKNESDTQKKDKLKIIEESSNSLLHIINDILDFSKIESGKFFVENIPFNVIDVFMLNVELFFAKAKEKDIEIKLFIDNNLPKRILGDSVRLKQVFSNLLSNAIKFSNTHTTITVNLKHIEDENLLLCEVIDNGIGIETKKLTHIFNPFEQADASTTRKYGGTGLGLSISSTLVKLMGGEIGTKSKIGVGSTFYFTLPLVVSQESEENEKIIDTESKQLKGNILIVEDNKTNQMLLSILLDELGLENEMVNDGIEAVEVVKNNHYDLILMDENMPFMNGSEATRLIKKMEDRKEIPIIAVTANALKGDKEKFIEAGMNDYLSKPIASEELKIILQKYLK